MAKTSTTYISPWAIGIVLVLVYASLFVLVPFFLTHKGWIYITACIFFGIGLRWQIREIVKRGHISIGFHLWNPMRPKGDRFQFVGYEVPIHNEKRFTMVITVGMTLIALFIVPAVVVIMANQAVVLTGQVEANTAELTAMVRGAVSASNETLGTNIDIGPDSDFKSLYERVLGDAVSDVKDAMKEVLKSMAESVAHFFGSWLKVTIATFIIGAFISPKSYEHAVKMHRWIITHGIVNEAARNTVLRGGELFQEKLGQFMVGYLEVASRLMLLFFAVLYVLLPSGMGVWAAGGISVFLGLITAIPKIGGILGMIIGFVLMSLNLKAGFGWSWMGFELISTGSAWIDTLIRMVMLGLTAKVLGLFEAYKFTPEIVGKKIGLDKMQIVFIVVMFALGGFANLVWGVIGLSTLAAVIALTREVLEAAGEEVDDPTADEPHVSALDAHTAAPEA